MTIGEQAIKRFSENEPPGSFAAALLRCFLFGIVVKRPDFVLLAEPVWTDREKILLLKPDDPSLNCWWIWYAAANWGKTSLIIFMDEAPFALPYVAFKRRGKLKIYSWNHMKKDIPIRKEMDGYGRSTTSSSASRA